MVLIPGANFRQKKGQKMAKKIDHFSVEKPVDELSILLITFDVF